MLKFVLIEEYYLAISNHSGKLKVVMNSNWYQMIEVY